MSDYKQQFKNILHGSTTTTNSADFYDEISHDWQEKARRLQARRWHKIHDAESRI